MLLFLSGAEDEEKVSQDQAQVVEGGAAKSKETGLASELKQPEEAAGALKDAGEHHAVAPNQVPAGNDDAELGALKVAVQMPHKEEELGARGVPLGKKTPNGGEGGESELLKEQKKIETLVKEHIEREVQARLEKEQVEREIKERLAKKEELIRLEREKIEQKVQASIEREKQEMLARQLQDKERIQKEVQARVEKQRLQREMRESLEREKAAAQLVHGPDGDALEKAKKAKRSEEAQERPVQPERAAEERNGGKAAPELQKDDEGEPLKKGGRDLKENVAIQVDPREGLEGRAVRDEAHPQGSPEKDPDQRETDLKRKRRALGPDGAAGPQEENRGVPGLEPLLSLGGSDLHAALEEQLLAGALVHSRQIKEAPKDEGEKERSPDTHLAV